MSLPTKVLVNLLPLGLRRLLRIQPLPHPKAMALFADAYLTLLDLTGDETYRTLAEGRLSWLREHASPGYSGLAWGLPFDYQGRDFVVVQLADGSQKRVDVLLGIITDERVEIAAGLEEGQTIVGE